MKKHIRVLTSLIIFVLIIILIPLLAYSETTMVEVTNNASIRTKPSYDGDKISLAKTGNQFLYLRTEGKWYAIQIENGTTGFLPMDSCKLIKITESAPENNQDAFDADYQDGIRFMDEGKYYSAHEAFLKSDTKSAMDMAQKCIQSWPETGELWHNPSVNESNMELIIKVIQESNQATLVKIYRENLHVADLFIGGTGQATAKLPAGIYIIKDGVGSDWYGLTEAFGRSGLYETLIFDEDDETVFQSGYAYTITISTTKPEQTDQWVNSIGLTWEGFYID